MQKQEYINQILSYEIVEFLPIVNEVQLVYTRPRIKEMKKLKDSQQVYELLKAIYPKNIINHREFFYVLFLNTSNHVLAVGKISEGGISGTVADTRMIFQHALLLNASGIIISHNHPSGNPVPSDADIKLTSTIQKAGKLMDIILLDHVILCDETYYSFADEGRL